MASTLPPLTQPVLTPEYHDVVIVGAGISGICAACQLKRKYNIHDIKILERSPDPSGTWTNNSYPGCACDVPAPVYSFSFATKGDWSTFYPQQKELKSYFTKVAAEHDLHKNFHFQTTVQEARFDNMGAFVYSPEEGTPAAKFKPKVPVKIARQRHHALMMAQQEISRERLAQWVGKTVPALVDEVAGDDTLICRTDAQAPDIDGVTTVTAVGQVEVGARLPVLITGSTEYDLRGVAQ